MRRIAFNTLLSVFIRLSFRALASVVFYVQLIVRLAVFLNSIAGIVLFFVVGLFGTSETLIVFEDWLVL